MKTYHAHTNTHELRFCVEFLIVLIEYLYFNSI
jgi:hypothetical protein